MHKDKQRAGNNGQIKLLKMLPRNRGKEAGLFSALRQGKTVEAKIGIEDSLLEQWGFKMDHARISSSITEKATGLNLREVIFFIGAFKIADYLLTDKEIRDYTFSKKDFKRDGRVMDMLSALEMILVPGKWIHEEQRKFYIDALRILAANEALRK